MGLSLWKPKHEKFSVKKAHASQLEASKRIIRRDALPNKIHYVAGVDVAYTRELSIGSAAVLNYNSLSLVEAKTTCVKTEFPYIPTLLSFREVPPTIAVIKDLRFQPDVFLVDGQGIMHPYRFGFASHLGYVLGKPTIGVAKSRLIGKVGEFNEANWARMTDKKEVVGVALVTRYGKKPVYVSIGHMVSLERAIEVVKHCTPTYRISKPIRLAHKLAVQERLKVKNRESAKKRGKR